jgi:predicted RNA-binding Zn-ribbon protein involved in translation (DUF1610 family)
MPRKTICCPNCGHNRIVIRVTAYLEYQSEGDGEIYRTDTDIGDFDHETPAECTSCEHEGQVQDFWTEED